VQQVTQGLMPVYAHRHAGLLPRRECSRGIPHPSTPHSRGQSSDCRPQPRKGAIFSGSSAQRVCCRQAGCGQAEIYEKCAAPLVDKFLGGANACLLAYGQTASGKTYTSGTDGGPRLQSAQ
jgi:Kinesin motor domain